MVSWDDLDHRTRRVEELMKVAPEQCCWGEVQPLRVVVLRAEAARGGRLSALDGLHSCE
jgi:hypothetical protein